MRPAPSSASKAYELSTEILLGACCGALAIIAVLVFLLHRSSARESSLFRHALAASASWWWQADADGRVLWAHAGRRRPVWMDTEPMVGHAFWEIPGTGTADPPEAIRDALAARMPFFDVVVRATLPGVGPLGARLSGLPYYAHGRFGGYAGTAALDDAPAETAGFDERLVQLEQERACERLEQARKFELAAKEMESFSYSVSHDLRSPLRVVDGFASIILEDYGARLDELGREHVKRIAAAANRMNAMIDALLAMSRRTGRELEIEPVDLSRAVRELADELRAGDISRKVEFRIEPDLRASGDPVLLRLVLQNLLGNAFKFSAHVPQAVIEFGRHVVDGADVFFLRDNGAGFDMRFAERLFGLFQRFHSQNEFPGTGVGLATVQRIVRKHGGRVWAESEPGKGACFYFTLENSPARPGRAAN
jgi:signal transduction histidine kinase